MKGFAGELVLVLYGDVPLLRRETLAALVGTARRYRCLAVVTATPPDPTGYGRILRDERGHVIGVVEEKDASPEERAITEVNAGIYCGPADFFREATAGLSARNAQREYYLTDIIARAAEGIGVTAVEADFRDVAGVNDRQQLAEAEAVMRARINRALMAHVTFRDPATTDVEPGVEVGVDVELGRGVALRGRTKIGHGARIGDGVILTDTEVGAGVLIRPYSVATEAVIGVGATVGPFAHLRPGTKHRPRRPHRQLRRDQEDHARARQQGQPPDLPRRHHRRGEGEHRRRHHHLQLQRLREVEDGDRRRRVHRVGHAAGGAGAGRQGGRGRRRHDGERRRAGRGAGDHARGADRKARLRAEGGEEICRRAQVRLGFSDSLSEVPMPTSVKAFFDQKVPAVLATNPEKAKDVAAIYLFKISGADGGTWTVDLLSTPPTCVVGEHGAAQCTIEASDDDFRGMIDGGMQAAMSLFFSGKLKVAGDPILATKLSKLLQMAG